VAHSATNAPILPSLGAKRNRLPKIFPQCSTWNTIRVSEFCCALCLGSCRYSLWACTAERPADFSNIPSGNHSSCSYRQFGLVFVGLDATAVSHVSGGTYRATGRDQNRPFLNPNQPILSQPRRARHSAERMCSTWNTVLINPQGFPLKSRRRSIQPAGTLGSNCTRFVQAFRAGHLAASRSLSMETERSMWNTCPGLKSVFMDNQVFHVEHKTHFAQKSEPLT
jgi:hypothetical protein